MTRKLTAEDRARIKAEAQAVLDRVMGGVREAEAERETEVHQAPKAPRQPRKPGVRRTTVNTERPPKYDRELIKKLYVDDQLGVQEIADRLGAHRSTISKSLTEAGIEERRGPKPRDLCKRNHDMAVYGRPNSGSRGGRRCIECKRIRERELEAAKRKQREES